jgi:membrane dipeptidase
VTEAGAAQTPCLIAAAPSLAPSSLGRELPRLRAAGIDVVLVTVASLEDTGQAMLRTAQWRRAITGCGPGASLCTRAGQLADTTGGPLGIVFHFQGTEPLQGSVDLLETFGALGLRVLQLTYNYRTMAGDGCCEPADSGLSEYGGRLVDAAVRHGITLDISHAGHRTSLDMIDKAGVPVVASHSNARAVCESPRNLTDDVIRAVASSGGVIGLNAFRAFVSGRPDPTIDDLVRHARYIADLTGPEHVGLGWDFAAETEEEYEFYGYDERYYPRPPWTWPDGLAWLEDTPNIFPALRAAGFSEPEIDGIRGGNFVRAFGRTWPG